MNNYFCVIPFFGALHSFKPHAHSHCCLIKPNSDIEKVRSAMLAGQRPDECMTCWKLEDQGITSDRQLKNSAFDFYADKDISVVEEECRNGNYSKQIVMFSTSNRCNSTCVTCDSNFSTAWAAIEHLPKTYKSIDARDQKLDFKETKMISFVGGEPLYEPKNFEILESLIAANNTNCAISIVTNSSVGLSDKERSILSNFKNINFCLSIDGIESKFEYLRYPSKWAKLLTNLEYFRSITDNISVSYTISNMNVWYYRETTAWFKEQNLPFNHNLVNYPNYFNLQALPEYVKDKLDLPELFAPHEAQHDELFAKAKQEISRQDSLKKISVSNYMPEFWSEVLSK